MTTYTYSKARQNLAKVLKEAEGKGEVRICCRDERAYTIRPLKRRTSALDVEGVRLGISSADIVKYVREGRAGRRYGR